MRADAETVDGRILSHQALQHVFIDAAAGEMVAFKAALVENAAHFESVIGQVAAVEPHPL